MHIARLFASIPQVTHYIWSVTSHFVEVNQVHTISLSLTPQNDKTFPSKKVTLLALTIFQNDRYVVPQISSVSYRIVFVSGNIFVVFVSSSTSIKGFTYEVSPGFLSSAIHDYSHYRLIEMV